MNIVFSILHYQNYEVTHQCVNSILALDKEKCDNVVVLVVDNKSSNDSFARLSSIYKDKKDVVLISTDKNLGFANGNNKGFAYAKNILQADLILVLNNDIIIDQVDFIDILKTVVANNPSVSIIAPSIRNKEGVTQNPYRSQRLSVLKTIRLWLIAVLYYSLLRIPLICDFFCYFIRIRHKIADRTASNKIINDQKLIWDIVPHGSALIYCHAFIEKEIQAFDNRTFLYAEEDLLMERIVRQGMHTLYVPNLEINHLEDASTNSITKSPLDKKLFMSEHKIKSTSILLKERLGIGKINNGWQ